MTTSLVPTRGSIQDVGKHGDMALALLDAKVVLLCDRSSSMLEIARSGKAAYEIEDEVVTKLQAKHQGQVALIAFADDAYLCLDGHLPYPNGNTNMLDAFTKAEPLASAGLRAILITDGMPSHDESEVIQHAQVFRGKMDCIFVGNELSGGADFLKRLAKSLKGSHSICDIGKEPKLLEEQLETLLLKAGK